MTKQHRGAGRPSATVLTEERILRAAFRVAASRGPAQFTMTALAQSLGVRPSALYHHYANRDAVVRAMRGRIGTLTDLAPLDREDTEEALVGWASSYREALLTAPGAITLLATLPIDADRESFVQYEAVTVRLLSAGWHEAKILDTIVALESFIIGSALDALAPRDNMSPGAFAEEFPRYAEAERLRASAAAEPATETFRIGLRALIAGLAAWARA
ncbi:TetR/AcrR family transcriptional regulator [Microbacterium sp. NPDC087589]|uniref:TetR/AcrR family transcriptional regulator n=1 Tax=Microbacterium sp. NPDC087589 TaxID=3364191 RepID=UPI00382A9B24